MTNTYDYDSDALVRSNAYLKFDVSEIPQTDAFQIVDIDAEHVVVPGFRDDYGFD